MISRSSAKLIAEIYGDIYSRREQIKDFFGRPTGHSEDAGKDEELYNFLYERDYEPWFMNDIKKMAFRSGKDGIIDFIKKLHTGESLVSITSNWTIKQKEKLGQRYLLDLAQDTIKEIGDITSGEGLLRKLELDGYIWNGEMLLLSESEVLDTEEAKGILESLIVELNLNNKETTLHHLKGSEDNYVNGRWDDSISNSRKFLESTIQEVATRHHVVVNDANLANDIYESPSRIRNYLNDKGLIEEKEKKAISAIYGLLSETGGHPYIAEKDQARLMRHLALTFCQFVLLRFKGFLNQRTSNN